MPKILVIKLSALGDFVLSIGSFQAIRAHHQGARITLLTTAPYVGLAEASGCFDEVWVDPRPRWWKIATWLALARRLRRAGFDRVYDLQRSQRTGLYFRLAGKPEWIGTVAGCTHRYQPPPDRALHIAEREAAQLALAGIRRVGPPDLSFIDADVGRFALPRSYALLVPGSAPHRPAKRWPAERYAEVARALAGRGIAPVLIGGPAERAELRRIAEGCVECRDLGGRTDLAEIVTLARGARVALGNDTGPIHLIAAAGCPVVVLFSRESHPIKSKPPWPHVHALQRPHLSDLPVDSVLAALGAIETDA